MPKYELEIHPHASESAKRLIVRLFTLITRGIPEVDIIDRVEPGERDDEVIIHTRDIDRRVAEAFETGLLCTYDSIVMKEKPVVIENLE